MYLYACPFAQFLELFSCVVHVGNNNGDVFPVVFCWVVVVVVVAVVVLLVGVGESVLPLVKGPRWKLAVLECYFDVLKFSVQLVL